MAHQEIPLARLLADQIHQVDRFLDPAGIGMEEDGAVAEMLRGSDI